ncbi:hypothetical protein INT45_013849 [Circinella minor]|uniref:WHIM1 domain-containing protein n=1 Tax=Circinella minor TaxID=1195481 RepID=A0A8H7RZT7_9FUNG|nr:hypothetical protein INT45_013849 [Circinella minor]
MPTTTTISSKATQFQWEFAYIYAFVCNFREYTDHGIHSFPDLQPEDLEQALEMETSELLNNLLSSFLSNILNRKKRVDNKHIFKELSKLINTKLQTFEINLDYNPLSEVSSFENLSAPVKLNILRWMVEWQLQESSSIHSILDTAPKSSELLRTQPIGSDSEKRTYWHFGDTAWLWREQKATLKKASTQWEIVCRDLDELEEFSKTLSQGKRVEKDLYQYIIEQVIPIVEDAQRKRERKARAMERQIEAEQLITTRRLRTNTKPVKYTFDDDEDDYDDLDDEEKYGDEEEGEEEFSDNESGGFKVKEPERPKPLRASSRLNSQRQTSQSSSPIQTSIEETIVLTEEESQEKGKSHENGHSHTIINEVDEPIISIE